MQNRVVCQLITCSMVAGLCYTSSHSVRLGTVTADLGAAQSVCTGESKDAQSCSQLTCMLTGRPSNQHQPGCKPHPRHANTL